MRFFSTFYSLPSTISPRGFTILFAVLISSIMLTVGIAIFNITVRELRLSSIVRDSERAIYVTDSGAECAYYNIFKMGRFSPTAVTNWTCSGQTVSVGGHGYADDPAGNPDNANATSTYTLYYDTNTRCVTVYVGQHIVNAVTRQVRTIVESHGFYPCDPTSLTRVERVYRVTF